VFSDHHSIALLAPTWSDPVVTRAVDTTAESAAQRLASYEAHYPHVRLGTFGGLRDLRCRSSRRSSYEMVHARGRLVSAGPRLPRCARVDIEISATSSRTVELLVRPRSRHIHRWGTRRQRRYFRLAHAAADHLQRVLTA
jgi:hypothetical protein